MWFLPEQEEQEYDDRRCQSDDRGNNYLETALEYRDLEGTGDQRRPVFWREKCEAMHPKSRWGVEAESNVFPRTMRDVDSRLALNDPLSINVQANRDVHVDNG